MCPLHIAFEGAIWAPGLSYQSVIEMVSLIARFTNGDQLIITYWEVVLIPSYYIYVAIYSCLY